MFTVAKIVQLFAVIINRLTGMYERHQLKQLGKTELRLELLHKQHRDRRNREAVKTRSEQAAARAFMMDHYIRSKGD